MKYSAVVISLITSVIITLKVFAQTPEIEYFLKKATSSAGKEKITALANLCKQFYSIDPHKGIRYGELALRLADSLKIPRAKSKVYNHIGVNYWALSDQETARMYYEKAYRNAVIFKDSFEIGMYYNWMGLLYESIGRFDSCLTMFNNELIIFRRLKNDERTGISLENIGTIHMHRGEMKTALTFLIEAEAIYKKLNNPGKMSPVLLKLGQIYSETKDYSAAEKYFRKGIELSLEIKNYQQVWIGLNAIGIVYKYQGRYDEALAKFTEALNTDVGIRNSSKNMSIYINIGSVYAARGMHQEALKFNRKALNLAIKLKLPLAIANTQYNMGDDYMGLKDYVQARSFYESAMAIFEKSNSRSNLIKAYESLIKVCNSIKDFSQSVKYYQLYIAAVDSLNRTELSSALDSIKIRFQSEETERENILLEQKSNIQNRVISLQRIIIISSVIIFILLLSLILVILKNRKKILLSKELMERNNIEILTQAEKLSVINEKLLELSKFKDSMNSFLVHDLKNPLNTIINIDPGKFSEQQLKGIKQSGKKMLDIVINILDISKYENNKMDLLYDNISISYLVNKAFNHIEYLAEQKSISLKLNFESDFIVKVDMQIIERVFINLFDNAIKHSPAGGLIKISTTFEGPLFLKIIVQDNGEGIESEFLTLIFDKFTQASRKHKGLNHSTGIGLAFCKLAVESHGGEIGVDSVVGEGASFWFTLPVAEAGDAMKINPVKNIDHNGNFEMPDLTAEEINLITVPCERLKKLSIHEVSDVKDIIKSIDSKGFEGISAWKLLLIDALHECNEMKFNKLTNMIFHDKF